MLGEGVIDGFAGEQQPDIQPAEERLDGELGVHAGAQFAAVLGSLEHRLAGGEALGPELLADVMVLGQVISQRERRSQIAAAIIIAPAATPIRKFGEANWSAMAPNESRLLSAIDGSAPA